MNPPRPERRTTLPRFTDRLELGDSGLSVSPYCLGMTQNPDVVLAAYDAGINFFFVTADLHYPVYEPLRVGLSRLLSRGGGIRDRVVIAVTSYITQRAFRGGPFEEAMHCTGLGHVDVAVMGGAYSSDVLDRLATAETLKQTRRFGVRATGVTFHDRSAAAQVLSTGLCDVGFVRYNCVHPGARFDLFPKIAARPPRTRAFNFKCMDGWLSPEEFAQLGLGDDYWQPRPVDAYRFALGRGELDGMLFVVNRLEHLDELARAVDEGPLSEDEDLAMLTLVTELRERQSQQRSG